MHLLPVGLTLAFLLCGQAAKLPQVGGVKPIEGRVKKTHTNGQEMEKGLIKFPIISSTTTEAPTSTSTTTPSTTTESPTIPSICIMYPMLPMCPQSTSATSLTTISNYLQALQAIQGYPINGNPFYPFEPYPPAPYPLGPYPPGPYPPGPYPPGPFPLYRNLSNTEQNPNYNYDSGYFRPQKRSKQESESAIDYEDIGDDQITKEKQRTINEDSQLLTVAVRKPFYNIFNRIFNVLSTET